MAPTYGRSYPMPTHRTSRLAVLLWVIIGLSLTVHVVFVVLGSTVLSDVKWLHEPFHAAVEMCGSVIALLVAWLLISLERRGEGTSYNVWVSGALAGMGVLDGLHAVVTVGNEFVWLHSLATFVGGALFVMVWIPKDFTRPQRWPLAVFVATFVVGLISILIPSTLPRMVVDRQFTFTAKALNLGGGVLMLAAAARLVMTWRESRNDDDLLFCLHAALFGGAAIMFEQSKLWDLPWWGWHLLRLAAYGVALWFVLRSDLQSQRHTLETAQTNEQLAAIIATSADAIIATSNEGKVMSWNTGAEKLLGYTAGEMIGNVLVRIVPEDRRGEVQRVLSGVQDGGQSFQFESVRIAKDGTPIDVALTLSPILNWRGKVVGASAILRDIREKKRQEAAMQNLNVELEQRVAARTAELTARNEELDSFAYAASHDLRAPLRNIETLANWVVEDGGEELPDVCREHLGTMFERVAAMNNLLTDLLEYSRVGRMESEPEAVDIAALVDEVKDLIEPPAEYEVRYIGEPTTLRTSKTAIRKVLQNLIGNAVNHRGEQGKRVEIDCRRVNGEWEFRVADDGPGIDPRFHRRVFEMFQTLGGENEGTGMGMAIVRKTIENFGGGITLDSQPGNGATFQFTWTDGGDSPDGHR